MDDFLTKLYEEEMDKTAGAELNEFVQTLPLNELEEYLGLTKVAVGGPTEAPLPDSAQGAELSAKQQEARSNIDKEHNSNPPPRHEDTRTTSQQGEGKKISKEAMVIGDKVGKLLAKVAACRMEKTVAFTTPEQKAKAKMLSSAMKAGAGKPAAQRKAMVSAAAGKLKQSQGDNDEGMETTAGVADIARAGLAKLKGVAGRAGEAFKGGRRFAGSKMKPTKTSVGKAEGMRGTTTVAPKAIRSLNEMARRGELGALGGGKLERAAFHVGEHGKKYLAGAGALTAAEIARRAAKGGKEKGAEAKAEIAATAMRLTRGAPDHIKTAAAAYAGQQIAKMSHPFELMKEAKEVVKPKRWMEGVHGQIRAIAEDPKVIKAQRRGARKGQATGAAVGGLGGGFLGAAAGGGGTAKSKLIHALIGAGLGATGGGIAGMGIGSERALSKALRRKGVERTWGGWGRGRFTEEAAKKYLKGKK